MSRGIESEKANWERSLEDGRERPEKRRGRRIDFCWKGTKIKEMNEEDFKVSERDAKEEKRRCELVRERLTDLL